MRVPYAWLREYCDPGVTPEELAERLAMTGTEVERVTSGAPPDVGPAPEGARDEPVLELEVTPNRVDCFGVYGVAREVHSISTAPLGPEPWGEDAAAEGEGEASDYASVAVEVPDLCPRFTARVFTDVTIGPSPAWLQARLFAAGQRPINNVVDITNYTMLLTAQPLHAFDLDKVPDGALTVRAATEGETMTTLDGEERRLDSETVLVCDRNGPSGIAGIMGGQVSEVSGDTTSVLLEVASWNGTNILRTSRLLGLRSEASSRFEKQLHPELCMRAQRIASRLVVELCGAKLVPGTIDVAAEIPAPRCLTLRGSRVEGLLGMPIEQADQIAYLERLGFGVEPAGDDLAVEVPPDRHYDVTREVDLIEEVGRVHGLDEHLPTTLPDTSGAVGRLTREQALRRRSEDAMRGLGFDEIVGWSFTDPDEMERLRIPAGDPRADAVVLANPLSEDQSVMRTTLLGSLLDVAARNLARDLDRVALFESGRVYLPSAEPGDGPLGGDFPGERPAPVVEPHRLACLAAGPLIPKSWRGGGEPADFFALKGVLEALAGQLGAELSFEDAAEPFLHPGRSAGVRVGGEDAGWIGEVHPLVCRQWGIEAAVAFEVELAALVGAASAGTEVFADIAAFPAVHQDLAVVVPAEISAAGVRAAVLTGGGELLHSAEVFDLYEGEQVGEGRKSLALRLEFRAEDRTLTDEEVAGLRSSIEAELEKVGGSLRG
jgi:phenylalanyl-tRNA synthetase beta chain